MSRLGVRAPRALAVLAVLAALGALPACGPRVPQVPSGFVEELAGSVPAPTALATFPDGRLLLTSQTGQVRLTTASGEVDPAVVLDLSGSICTNSERGLLGAAVDPAVASNGHVYLFYTFDRNGTCEARSDASRTPVNRVSRFTFGPDGLLSPASERVLLDGIPSFGGNHNAGDLEVGNDGHLYASTGDGGCDHAEDSGCGGANDAARDRHSLVGKVLRITRSGGIPADNPFVGTGTARCNSGNAAAGLICRETFAWGLRNPFRMVFDPNVSRTRFFVNDVGQNLYEEVNLGTKGADFGWNVREGNCANDSTTDCGASPTGTTGPLFAYGRDDGCGSITGGAFAPATVWPAPYDGRFLFGDYVCNRIFWLTPSGGGRYSRSTFATGLAGGGPVDLAFGAAAAGAAGQTTALYYTTYAGGGQLRRIRYTGTGNRPPTAALGASPVTGDLPLTVDFDARASRDADGDALRYRFDFGDGTAATETASPTVSHTYTRAGTFQATVRAIDSRGALSSPVGVRLDPGNTAPTAEITSPAPSDRFSVGERVTTTAEVSDAEDGALTGSSLEWTAILHHASHTHPLVAPTRGSTLSFSYPPPEDLAAASNSYVEVVLRATDRQGVTTEVRHDLRPRSVALDIATTPAGQHVTVDGSEVEDGTTLTSWAGHQLTVDAPDQTDPSGNPLVFSSWSDGGARTHAIVTPGSPTTYRATFRPR